jgi:hypothetical protein
MKRKYNFAYVAVMLALLTNAVLPSVRAQQGDKAAPQRATASHPAATTPPPLTVVIGNGTPGQLVKWTGVDGSSVGNSIITETKLGNVGIGTPTPASKLTVQGMIETTLGGFKFPDGTVQTTAGIASVFHDQTLTGAGTANSPLGIANGAVVRSINGLTDQVTLDVDNTLKLQSNGNTLTLGVAAPLALSGNTRGDVGVLTVRNSAQHPSFAIVAFGGPGVSDNPGGSGVFGKGGPGSKTQNGGAGVEASGGDTDDDSTGTPGFGGILHGGSARNGSGGIGVHAEGGFGSGTGHRGGTGLFAAGGVGENGAPLGLAAELDGDVTITGNLSKGGGSFKIDHPLDPENKYLYHSFVESPDMMNIYNGTATTDGSGEATVTLPDWFEALNQDFRYQLTVIGTFAQAIVEQKVKDNRFVIKTNAPNVEVSWQVTGIRHDAYANKHRIPVEEDKPADERGKYLHPDAFNQPDNQGVQFTKRLSRSKG